MLLNYFDRIFVHLRQNVHIRPELSPKFLSAFGPNPTQKARPDLQLWIGVFSQKAAFFCCIFKLQSYCSGLSKNRTELLGMQTVADPENFGGGGFEAQNLKNLDVFTKIESDFSAELGNSNVFFAQIQVVSKKKKKKSSPKLRLIFRRIRYV